ncbi:MAG: DUF4956 domain-containing protein [Nanoarchaeota archaeon]|nr:DUF4956 domain-containing protein [Nanoarchaeota archaeon]
MAQITFQDIFSGSTTLISSFSIKEIFISLTIALMLSLIIYYIYQKTYSGILYSKNFNITLILITLIVAVLMKAISGSFALSLGMVGALSIIRFRTAIKDPKDVAFLFWAVSIGITAGVGLYKLSIISTFFIAALVLISSKYMTFKTQHLLILKTNSIKKVEINKSLKKYCKNYKTRSTIYSKKSGCEISIELTIKQNNEQALLDDFQKMEDIKEILLFTHEGHLIE